MRQILAILAADAAQIAALRAQVGKKKAAP